MAWRRPGYGITAGWMPSGWMRKGGCVSTGGLLVLLESAVLPKAELLHMGATASLLGHHPASLTPVEVAAALLGRVAWDACDGACGCVWRGSSAQAAGAEALGRFIINELFR